MEFYTHRHTQAYSNRDRDTQRHTVTQTETDSGERHRGVHMDGELVRNLHYADDVGLTAESSEGLQGLRGVKLREIVPKF